MPNSNAGLIRIAAVCGLLGAALLTADWIVSGIFEQNYDNFRQDISDFGALTASHPLPYNIALSISGALTAALGVGLFIALGRGLTAWLGSLAVFVFGAGDFLDGMLREDCSTSGDKACRAAMNAGQLSWHHQAHDIESVVTIAAAIAAPLILAFAFRQRDRWRDLFAWSLVAEAVLVTAIVWYAAVYGGSYSGLLQRVAIAAFTVWTAVVSLRLYRVA